MVKAALRLSAHILAEDPRQLPGQLAGRLPRDVPRLQQLTRQYVGPCQPRRERSRAPRPSRVMLTWHSGAVVPTSTTPGSAAGRSLQRRPFDTDMLLQWIAPIRCQPFGGSTSLR
jgi:hypothetical protein